MGGDHAAAMEGSAWNPGVGAGIPAEFRALETILRPECAFTAFTEIDELVALTGLPHEELTLFRPQRLTLHEIIIRVTADIAVAEGEEEEDFGRNFRRIAARIGETHVAPQLERIEHAYAELGRRADALVREILAETLFSPPAPVAARQGWFGRWRAPEPPAAPESVTEREYRIVAEYKTQGLAAADPLRRAVFKSLYRVLGAMAGKRGRLGADRDLLATLVARHVCNSQGSQLIGQLIAPLVDAAIEREAYARVATREKPVLISLKGASAAGKSSLRPMLKQVLREQGIEPDGYATISPDVWRRLLLDYESLGPARKYAGHLTSRELMVIDGKLDRYIRDQANRVGAIPHLLVDRFRFDSFTADKVGRVLHDTYARYVDTMYMYFIVTPPEETVERGWRRALERGRYKAVEDFLAHGVEAYRGMPKILFKWLASPRPDYRYVFLDNRVPRGTYPRTIARGDRNAMVIYDPVALIDIERYQKVDIHADAPEHIYPPAAELAVAANCGFLRECVRRIGRVDFVDRTSGAAYLRALQGSFEVLDAALLAKAKSAPDVAAALDEIAPALRIGPASAGT
ncbi:MAG: zeta toxin family protein [Sulfuritalea sp.]|nr:zeta toxin family protein [Sulfuritalea sp.]